MNTFIYVNADSTIANVSAAQKPLTNFEEGAAEYEVLHTLLLQKIIDGYDTTKLAISGVRFIPGENDFTLEYPENDEPVLSEAQKVQNIQFEIIAMLTESRAELVDANDLFEVSGYLIKQAIATKVLTSTASADEIALLQAEVDERDIDGETVTTLAQKQVTRAVNLTKSVYVMDGIQKSISDRLVEADTVAEAQDLKDEAEARILALKLAFFNDAL